MGAMRRNLRWSSSLTRFLLFTILQNTIMPSRCEESQNAKMEGQNVKLEGQNVRTQRQNVQNELTDASPVPILPTIFVPPASVTLKPSQMNNAVAETVPTLPSSGLMWGSGWMQLPGLISVPRLDWAANTNNNANGNANANANNVISSPPFSPTALLAKRDDQQQRQTPAESGEHGGDKSANDTKRTAAQFVGIRVRFNPPIFEETARLFFSVFNHEAQHIQIPPQKQCFAEGCFHLHTFHISGFQRPRAITLKPLGPNGLLLNILSFDVDIESLLNGSVQLLITSVPITGNFFVSARQLSITALFDLQKDQHKVPYLRIVTCELRSGMISTKVTNLGLLTEPINLKYKNEMLEKAKELITSTICETISDTIRERVNRVLRRLPRAISVAKIIGSFASSDSAADECSSPPVALQLDGGPPPPSTQRFYSNQLTLSYSNDPRGNGKDGGHRRFWRQKQRRRRRGLEVIDFETDKIPSSKTKSAEKLNEVNGKNKTVQKEKQKLSQLDADDDKIRKFGQNSKEQLGNNSAKTGPSSAECPTNYASLLDFLDLHSLAQAFIELDFLDSSAGSDFFAVGLSGNAFMRSPPPITTHVGGGGVVMHDIVQLGSVRSKNVPDEEDKSLLRDADKLEEDQQQRDNNNRRELPPMLRFPGVGPIGYQRKTLEMIFSDLSANLALLQAFRTKLLKVRLGPNSSVFGQMLRTTCGPDEVCLSDSIPEMGEKYPDQQLEVEIEPVESPFIKFSKDLATLNIVGTATFLLSQNGQTIGRIPFSATVELGVRHNRTTNASSSSTSSSNSTLAHNKMDVSLAIPRLDLRDDVIDFFGLPSSTLDGFLNTVRNAILNSAGRALSPGISLVGLERRLCPYGISQPGIQLLDNGLVLMDAELDAYVLLFDSGETKLCSLAEL
uniref:Lipid-binding serum glycoprotein C-terminal domain-containing protein n=1 Tax=Globodera rostochiensis TaxID=31243 RepID=A0A914IDL9_GLORO